MLFYALGGGFSLLYVELVVSHIDVFLHKFFRVPEPTAISIKSLTQPSRWSSTSQAQPPTGHKGGDRTMNLLRSTPSTAGFSLTSGELTQLDRPMWRRGHHISQRIRAPSPTNRGCFEGPDPERVTRWRLVRPLPWRARSDS